MEKVFKTIPEQMDILSKRNLTFEDKEKARDNLLRYGYYEIVNGYKTPLIDEELSTEDVEVYKKGATFEHLFSLYQMDKGLQESVRNSTLIFEEIIKTAMAYHISEKYGHLESDYLRNHNYYSGKIGDDGKSQLYHLQTKFKNIINDDLEPFKHYREDHGYTPAWILFKGASLGNIKIFYTLLKDPIKNKVIKTVLGIPEILEEDKYPNEIYEYFAALLNLAHLFRNRASHGGRIYNYKANYYSTPYIKRLHDPMGISKRKFIKYKLGKNDLYTLLKFLEKIDDKKPYIKLRVGINYFIEEHLKVYPEDKKFLYEQIGIPKNLFDKKLDDIL